jgi:hypothetical protein
MARQKEVRELKKAVIKSLEFLTSTDEKLQNSKVVTLKNKKQVTFIISLERGKLITIIISHIRIPFVSV